MVLLELRAVLRVENCPYSLRVDVHKLFFRASQLARVVWLQQADIDILLLRIADQFLQTLLSSDPRLLIAAKRRSEKMGSDC